MSSDAIGWVFRCSPYRGATLTVHLAIADSVNDQHGYELWMRQGVLAKKARVSRKAVNDALARMCEDRLLELMEEGQGQRANRYVFHMPDVPTVFDVRPPVTRGASPARKVAPQATGPVTSGASEVSPAVTQIPSSNPRPTQEPPAAPEAPSDPAREVVDAFWKWCTEQGRPTPTLPNGGHGNAFMALVHVVRKLLEAGHPVPAVKVALTTTPTFTINAMTLQLNQRRPPTAGARAPITADRERPSGVVSEL